MKILYILFILISFVQTSLAQAIQRNIAGHYFFNPIQQDSIFIDNPTEDSSTAYFYYSQFSSSFSLQIIEASPNCSGQILERSTSHRKHGIIQLKFLNTIGLHQYELKLEVKSGIYFTLKLEREIIDINTVSQQQKIDFLKTSIQVLDEYFGHKKTLINLYDTPEFYSYTWIDADGSITHGDTVYLLDYDYCIRQDKLLQAINYLETSTLLNSELKFRTSYSVKRACEDNLDPNPPHMNDDPCGFNISRTGADLYILHCTNPEVYTELRTAWIKKFQNRYDLEFPNLMKHSKF